MEMRFFSIIRIISLAAVAAGLMLAPAALFAANPLMTSTTVEVTLDNFDCGGTGAPGYSAVDNLAFGSLGSPFCITRMSGGTYSLIAGFYAQDLVAPTAVTSIWNYNGGSARSVTLQWTAPGDNQRDDSLLWGSRFHISSTTVEASALDPNYWAAKRDNPDVIISTYNVTPLSICQYKVTGLNAGTTYYFRIWTLDQAGNWADLSGGGTTYARPVILSVYVVDPSTYDFGMQLTNISTISASGILVRNNGNVNEAYLIKITTGTTWPSNTVWDAGSSPGYDQFAMYTVFNSTRPSAPNFGSSPGDDLLALTPYQASMTNFSMGYQGGTAVPPEMDNPLLSDNTAWFLLKTPLATSTTSSQLITIIYTAIESP